MALWVVHVNIENIILGGRGMKKTAQIFGVLLSLVMAMVVTVGCSTGDDDDDGGDGKDKGGGGLLTSEFKAYYLNLGDFDLDKAINTFHFKNKTSGVVGFEIQKIFVSQTKSETGATVVYDFTGAADADAALKNAYWGFGAGTVGGDKWTSGEVAAADSASGETYITGFGSPAAYETSAVYCGFVAKNISDTV
jgi:hypothetical protein